MTFAAAAIALPSLWTGLIREWARAQRARMIDPGVSLTEAEAIAHLKNLIRQYEQSQPSYADDLRSALAQLDGQRDAS